MFPVVGRPDGARTEGHYLHPHSPSTFDLMILMVPFPLRMFYNSTLHLLLETPTSPRQAEQGEHLPPPHRTGGGIRDQSSWLIPPPTGAVHIFMNTFLTAETWITPPGGEGKDLLYLRHSSSIVRREFLLNTRLFP